jgi:cytochrome c-type biogenesis protein CcmF
MNPELGHFALILAMLVALVLATLPMVARRAAMLPGCALHGPPPSCMARC